MENNRAQQEIESKIHRLIEKLDNIPEYLIPKVNVSNDYASPYIDIGFGGTLYYVVRERGIEFERIIFSDIDSLLFKIFGNITFELAMKKELALRKSEEEYSILTIYQIQDKLLKIINPEWKIIR